MFAVIFICGNLFLRIAGKTAKIAKKLEPAKNLCHTVRALGSLGDFRIKRGVCKQCKMRTGYRAYEDADGRCENADGKKKIL